MITQAYFQVVSAPRHSETIVRRTPSSLPRFRVFPRPPRLSTDESRSRVHIDGVINFAFYRLSKLSRDFGVAEEGEEVVEDDDEEEENEEEERRSPVTFLFLVLLGARAMKWHKRRRRIDCEPVYTLVN